METLVRERLDRFVADNSWCNMFSYAEVIYIFLYVNRIMVSSLAFEIWGESGETAIGETISF